MAQPDDIEISPVVSNTHAETSFIDNSFATDDDNPIIEDFTAVSEGVRYLNDYTSEHAPEKASDKAEEAYGVKENTIKRIISARWLLNDYLSSDERDPQEKFHNLQRFTRDIVSFLKILFFLETSDSVPEAEGEVKSKHSTRVPIPGDSDPTDSSPLLRHYETHEADDIAILQGIRAEVESYSQQWVDIGESSEPGKKVFSDPDLDEFSQFKPITFRSLSNRRNLLWLLLGIIVGVVVFFIFIILLLIIIFSVNR